jgi:hypothetical protein
MITVKTDIYILIPHILSPTTGPAESLENKIFHPAEQTQPLLTGHPLSHLGQSEVTAPR